MTEADYQYLMDQYELTGKPALKVHYTNLKQALAAYEFDLDEEEEEDEEEAKQAYQASLERKKTEQENIRKYLEEQNQKKKADQNAAAGAEQTPDKAAQPGVERSDTPSLAKSAADAAQAEEDEPEDF